MRRWAFVVALVGMFVLSLFLSFGEKQVDNLEDLKLNSRVIVSGEVVSERAISSGRLLELDNGIVVVCECVESFDGKEVEILGVISEFEGEKQVDVLEITIL